MDDAKEPTKVDPVPEGTGATQGTDLHKSKISPDDPRLLIDRPRSRTLRKGPLLAAILALGGVVAVALVVALAGPSGDQAAKKDQPDPEVSTSNPVALPDVINDAPVTTQGAPRATRGGPDTSAPTAPAAFDQRAEATRQARQEELLRARGAGLFSGVDDGPVVAQQGQPDGTRRGDGSREGDPSGAATGRGVGNADPSRPPDPNLQERKNDFLARAGVSSAEYLEKGVSFPRSPFEVKAGTLIPTVLISGINSDLPGQVVAQVRENVYDTVSGNYLLIPQGSRLLAAYDSMVAWGQERVLVCWNRLIRPDGSSIALECMPGADLAGYAGFADEVDNHWWKIISGAVFSSVLAATAQRSQGDVTGLQPTFPQVWASNAAGQINQAGQQLTQKNLQIQPTITVRPGFSVNVLVTKDIVIDPYHRQGATP
jgi:type IV secretory pathway VirB10-like protein